MDQLVERAQHLHLLVDHRFIDGFVYLDVGTRRYVLDEHMGRSFLMGLLAGQLEASDALTVPEVA